MGNRYTDTFVYAVGEGNALSCIYSKYFSALGDAYRSEVQIGDKRYSLLDLIDGECETEGEYLPEPDLAEWKTAFSDAPAKTVAEVFQWAGVTPSSVSKLIWIRLDSVRAGAYGFEGYILSRSGCIAMGESVFAPYSGSKMDVEALAECIADDVR